MCICESCLTSFGNISGLSKKKLNRGTCRILLHVSWPSCCCLSYTFQILYLPLRYSKSHEGTQSALRWFRQLFVSWSMPLLVFVWLLVLLADEVQKRNVTIWTSLDVAVKKGIQVKNCALLALLGAWWHLRGFSELGAGWHGWPGKWFKSPLQESGSGDTSNELPSSHKIILTDTHLYNPPLIPIDKQNLDLFWSISLSNGLQVNMSSAEVMAKTVGVGDPQISDSRDHQNIEIHSLNPMSSVEFSEKIDSKTVYVEIYYLHFVVCRNKQALTTDIAPRKSTSQLASKVWFSWLLLLFLVATSLPLLEAWQHIISAH